MSKKVFAYTAAFILLLVVLLFFNRTYQELTTYAELYNRQNNVYNSFQNLHNKINNAAILTPDLTKANAASDEKLFLTDSSLIIQQLDLLRSTVKDSVNVQIAEKLDKIIRPELSWLINSNVSDSFIHHRSPAHIASFQQINTLIASAIQRTNYLIEFHKKLLDDEMTKIKIWISAFIILSGLLLIYTSMSLFNQKSQIKGKEKELETVFNRVNDGVFSLDNNWRYTFLNDAAMVVHPFTKKEIIGKFLWEVHPQIRESEFWTNYQEAIKTKEVMEFESYYQPMDKWFSVKVYPSDNGLTIFYRDINEDKKKEKALSQTLKEITDYKFALDQSSIVAVTDQKGIIKHVNQNFCKISRYSEEELIGQDHRVINSGFHSKDFIRNLWVTIANGKIWKGEMKNKAKDGSFYWVDTTIVPFLNEAGKPYQYVAIRADITERKQTEQALQESEQLLSAIIDNSTAVIYVKNLEGKYLLVNRRFSELFHLDIDAALDKTDYDLFSKEQADAFRRIDVLAAAADHALTEEEVAPHDDGLHTYISVKRVLKDHAGQPYAIFGISTDITEQKKIEHNLRRSLREISDYKFALDESSIVAITDQKGIIKYANQNFCNISKYSVDELMGQDHRIINSGYHTKEFIKNIWVTIANGEIWKGEIKNKAKDGSYYWVDTTIVPFLNEEGKPYQYMAIRADITSRKEI